MQSEWGVRLSCRCKPSTLQQYSLLLYDLFVFFKDRNYISKRHWTELCIICSVFHWRICQIIWNKLKYNKLKRNSTFYHWSYFVFLYCWGPSLTYHMFSILLLPPFTCFIMQWNIRETTLTSLPPVWRISHRKKHSPVAGPFPRVIKSLKVLIMANTPITVWAHMGCPPFSSPLKHYFAIKLQF